jgi:hypothetical protein
MRGFKISKYMHFFSVASLCSCASRRNSYFRLLFFGISHLREMGFRGPPGVGGADL